jgi:hypothetical protein
LGGVEVEASSQIANYNRLKRYVLIEQPRQIKQDLQKTIRSYRSKNKKYKQASFEPTINYLYKRFSVNRNNFGGDQNVVIAHAMIYTEYFLASVINNERKTRMADDTSNGIYRMDGVRLYYY